MVVAALPASPQINPCLIVKHKGTVGRRLMWFALIAIPIAPGSKYDYVDSIDYQTKKMKFGAKDLQKVQDSGVHVVILNKDFAAADLEAGHNACRGVPAPPAMATPAASAVEPSAKPLTEAKSLGVSGYAEDAGFRVISLAPKSPAELVDIHPGDVISKIDGRDVRKAEDIEMAIAQSTDSAVQVTLLIQTVSIGIVRAERKAKVR